MLFKWKIQKIKMAARQSAIVNQNLIKFAGTHLTNTCKQCVNLKFFFSVIVSVYSCKFSLIIIICKNKRAIPPPVYIKLSRAVNNNNNKKLMEE